MFGSKSGMSVFLMVHGKWLWVFQHVGSTSGLANVGQHVGNGAWQVVVGWSACWQHKWVGKHVSYGAWQVVVGWSACWQHQWVRPYVGNGVWKVIVG